MGHSNGQDVGCNISELGGAFVWPAQIAEILGALLVNLVEYVSGTLICVGF